MSARRVVGNVPRGCRERERESVLVERNGYGNNPRLRRQRKGTVVSERERERTKERARERKRVEREIDNAEAGISRRKYFSAAGESLDDNFSARPMPAIVRFFLHVVAAFHAHL